MDKAIQYSKGEHNAYLQEKLDITLEALNDIDTKAIAAAQKCTLVGTDSMNIKDDGTMASSRSK